MSLRKTVNGRPSGTDGSDFSYRMVVDSRYQKVAVGKSRLCSLIVTQGFIQFLAAAVLYLSTLEGGIIDKVSISSSVIFFISLLLGEIGRKRSRVNLLKLFLFGSSVAALISVAFLLKSEKLIEIIKALNTLETPKSELFKTAAVLLGFMTQILTINVTTSLIHNMAPPKRTS